MDSINRSNELDFKEGGNAESDVMLTYGQSESKTLKLANNHIDFSDEATRKNLHEMIDENVDIIEYANLDIYDRFLIQQM